MQLYKTELANNVIPIRKKDKDNINIEINNLYYFEAPVMQDEIVGSLKVMLNNAVVDVLEIKNRNLIQKKDVLDYFKLFLMKIKV